MEDDITTLDSLIDHPNGGVAYLPVCAPCIDTPQDPFFALGAPAEDLLTTYRAERLRASSGVYTAENLGLFERALLIRGETALRCDRIEVTQQNVRKFLPLWHSMSSRVRTRNVSGACVLLLGRGYHVWGHWLVDFLPKLHVLRMAGHDLGKLKYLVPDDTPAFGMRLLDMAGIIANKRIVYHHDAELVRPERLLIPTLVRWGNRPTAIFRDAVRFTTTLLRANAVDETRDIGPDRIFVSRGHFGSPLRRLLNRDRIEQIAAGMGFTIVHPEGMTPGEQFALFTDARLIAGDYGSALHTSIFSVPGTRLCALRGTQPMPLLVQSAIADELNQPTGYVFGDMVSNDPTESFTISESAFEEGLERILCPATASPTGTGTDDLALPG